MYFPSFLIFVLMMFRGYIRWVLCIALFFELYACKSAGPSGFWSGFHEQEITIHNNDQGPWGGHRQIQWKGKHGDHVSVPEIITYAAKNGWKYSRQYSFPLETNQQCYTYLQLKERIPLQMQSAGNRMLVFQTDWLLVEPGDQSETYENGFFILSADSTEWIMWHIWGE